MICDAILRIIVGSDLFTTIHCCYLRLAFWLLLYHGAFVFDLKESLLQKVSRSFLVHLLTSLFLDEYRQPRRDVSSPAGRLNLIHCLTPWPAWACELILDILLIDFKRKRDNWHYYYRNSTRVKSTFRLGLWYSNHFVHTRLGFKRFMHILALDTHVQRPVSLSMSCLLHSRGNVAAPPLCWAKRFVHLADILHKNGRFCSPCSWSQLHDDVVGSIV